MLARPKLPAAVMFLLAAPVLASPHLFAQTSPPGETRAGREADVAGGSVVAAADSVDVSPSEEEDRPGSSGPQEIVQDRKLPVLSGHRFIPTSTVPDPFITSYLRSQTGFGLLLDARLPVLTEADTVAVLEGDIAFAILGFEYQQAIVDFLALRIGFGGAVRTGTSGESLLAEGLNASYAFQAGLTGRVLQTRRVVLSAVADFQSNRLIAMDPFGFAQRVADECAEAPDVSQCILDSEEELLSSGRSNAFTGGLRAAWSPIDWFGLRGRTEFGAGDAFDPNSDLGTTILRVGAVADVDLIEVTPVPIGFLLGFDAQLFGSRGSDIAESATRFSLGFFYTGRKEFSVGLESVFGRVALAQVDDSVDSISFNLRLRYFF